MNNAKVAYISDRWECTESAFLKIGIPPRAVRLSVIIEISQPPPDLVSVFVPSVAISRNILVSSSVANELG